MNNIHPIEEGSGDDAVIGDGRGLILLTFRLGRGNLFSRRELFETMDGCDLALLRYK
jgi:hypothetical protein